MSNIYLLTWIAEDEEIPSNTYIMADSKIKANKKFKEKIKKSSYQNVTITLFEDMGEGTEEDLEELSDPCESQFYIII